jgi:hypothetical protein
MQPIIEQLALEVRHLYEQDSAEARTSIEDYLNRQLTGLDYSTKKQFISLLEEMFPPLPEPEAVAEKDPLQEYLLRFCSLILGKTLSPAELSSPETLERLSRSFNTIFDSLNQLVHSIRMTLFLEDQMEETIRHVIGSSLNNDGPSVSLEHYLGEIKSAFFLSHQAFKSATGKMIDKILLELDPEQLARADNGGFMLSAMRKAHSFDRYKQVFENCKRWHDSGHSMEDFLKEFEKECQTLSKQPRR